MPASRTPSASTTATTPSGIASIAARVDFGEDQDSGVARSSRAGTKRRVKAGPTTRLPAAVCERHRPAHPGAADALLQKHGGDSGGRGALKRGGGLGRERHEDVLWLVGLPVADFAFGRTLKRLSSMFGDAQSSARKGVEDIMRTISGWMGSPGSRRRRWDWEFSSPDWDFVMWTALSVFGGLASDESAFRLREAWDTAAYFYVGIPVMALAVGDRSLHPATSAPGAGRFGWSPATRPACSSSASACNRA